MKFQLYIVLILICVYGYMAIDICSGITKLKRNVLKFGYGINYKYEGTLSHSFDRLYVVTKYELPKVEYLKFMTISYDSDCKYLDDVKDRKDFPQSLVKDIKVYCAKILLHVAFYKKQVDYYDQTAYEIITNELALILSTISEQERQKKSIITSLIIGFIGLAYEGISTFLHYKRQKALHKVVKVMENNKDIQCNKLFHLEESVVLYGIYNSDTLENLTENSA